MNKKGKRTDAPKGKKTSTNSEFVEGHIKLPKNYEVIKLPEINIDIKEMKKQYKNSNRVVIAMSTDQAEKLLAAMEMADAGITGIAKDDEVFVNWNSIEKRIKKTLESHKGKEAQ